MSKTLRIINEWDPMNFLSHAPDDEYEEEAKLIDELLNSTSDVNELVNGILNVFTRMFGDDFKRSREECLLVAKSLLSKET